MKDFVPSPRHLEVPREEPREGEEPRCSASRLLKPASGQALPFSVDSGAAAVGVAMWFDP